MAVYSIVNINANNLWMRAERIVGRGDEILAEQPLLKLEVGLTDIYKDEFFDKNEEKNIIQAFERERRAMDPRSRSLLDALHNSQPRRGLIGRIRTNAYDEDEARRDQSYKVFLVYNEISRVNHSCQPNAEVHRNPNTNVGSLRALRQIEPNEEFLVSYLGARTTLYTRVARRLELRKLFGFDCNCIVCRNGVNDNALRMEAREIYDLIEKPLPPQDVHRLARLTKAHRYIQLLQQLNIQDQRMAWAYNKLADLHTEMWPVARDAQAGFGHAHSNHCERHRNGGHIWHLRRALDAWTEAQRYDMLTYAPDHPQLERDLSEVIKVQGLIMRNV